MSLEEEFRRLAPAGGTLLTIGVFDGVHRGHQKLLAELNLQAEAAHLTSGVITFNNHPLSRLGQGPPPLLSSVETKNRMLKDLGAGFIANMDFSVELAAMGAREFSQMLVRQLNMKGLVLGFDFAMGRNREGSLEMMQLLALEMGFGLTIVPPVKIEGEIVSSTAIRRMILSGKVSQAARFLGRYHSLEGRVKKGKGLGKKLGFPTANLKIDPRFVVPPNGIYAAFCHTGSRRYGCAVNIGTGPTFEGTERLIEAHLLDFDGELYRSELQIEIVERIRDELRFQTVDELVTRIEDDIARIRQIIERESRPWDT